jgi:hypothetical protein
MTRPIAATRHLHQSLFVAADAAHCEIVICSPRLWREPSLVELAARDLWAAQCSPNGESHCCHASPVPSTVVAAAAAHRANHVNAHRDSCGGAMFSQDRDKAVGASLPATWWAAQCSIHDEADCRHATPAPVVVVAADAAHCEIVICSPRLWREPSLVELAARDLWAAQ